MHFVLYNVDRGRQSAIYLSFAEYDYIDESKMDIICMSKFRAPASNIPTPLLSQNRGHRNCRYFSDRAYNPGTNCTMLQQHHSDVTTRQYEQLNKETMEPQPDSECSGTEDSPCHLFPDTPLVDSQNFNYMDIICQRIAALVVQQFDSLTKSDYIAPNVLSSMGENETPHDHFHGSIENRYPAHMGLQRQGVMEWHGGYKRQCRGIGCDKDADRIPQGSNACKNYNCWPFRADTFECPHFTEKRLLAPDMEKQHHDRSVDTMKSNLAVESPDQHCVLPDVGVKVHEEFDDDLISSLCSKTLVSLSHGQDFDVDSFGLPMTTFEREAKQDTDQ